MIHLHIVIKPFLDQARRVTNTHFGQKRNRHPPTILGILQAKNQACASNFRELGAPNPYGIKKPNLGFGQSLSSGGSK